jgi:4-hydroxy-2-oxoglutarate aldolase
MNGRWPRTMPALITPFDADGNIDIGAHRHNTMTAVTFGAPGILIAGSTGEGPYLESGERSALVAAAREQAPDLIIVCGISAETDRQASSQIAETVSGGADAVLVITPGTLVRARTTLIEDYYRRTADLSVLPVLLYSNPVVAGYELPVESVERLATHPNVIGMKDSGGDVSRLDGMTDSLTDGFIVYVGSSRHLLESVRRGAHGAITASANYAYEYVDASATKNQKAQVALADATAMVQQFGVPGTKYAATLVGMIEGHSRLPLQSLAPEERRRIDTAYRDLIEHRLADA